MSPHDFFVLKEKAKEIYKNVLWSGSVVHVVQDLAELAVDCNKLRVEMLEKLEIKNKAPNNPK